MLLFKLKYLRQLSENPQIRVLGKLPSTKWAVLEVFESELGRGVCDEVSEHVICVVHIE